MNTKEFFFLSNVGLKELGLILKYPQNTNKTDVYEQGIQLPSMKP